MKLEDVWFENARMRQGDEYRIYIKQNGLCELFLKRCEVIRDKNDKVISLSLDFKDPNNINKVKLNIEEKAEESLRIDRLVYKIHGEKEYIAGFRKGYTQALCDTENRGLSHEEAFKRIVSVVNNTIGT